MISLYMCISQSRFEFSPYMQEYLLTILNDTSSGQVLLKSSDLGLGSPLSEMELGHITGIDAVHAVKVLDLDSLQPAEPSKCYGNIQDLAF